MRIMVDTNIIISAALFPGGRVSLMLKEIMQHYELVICTFSLEELFIVVERKFKHKKDEVDHFFRQLSYSLIYTPTSFEKKELPAIRDEKDYPILLSAIDGDVDVLISGDKDFACVECKRPEIMSPNEFTQKYLFM